MANISFKKDLFLLFCSLLFYLGFLVLNVTHEVTGSKENQSFNNYDTPPELCTPRYENRMYQDESGHISIKCVKIGIPDIKIYDKSCEELGYKNEENSDGCVID